MYRWPAAAQWHNAAVDVDECNMLLSSVLLSGFPAAVVVCSPFGVMWASRVVSFDR
jgi:hypothetical protein